MWNFAEVAGQESVLLHKQAGDRTAEAAAHDVLAQAAEGAGDVRLAEEQYQQAHLILDHSQTADPAALLTLEIERAAVEVRQNKNGFSRSSLSCSCSRLIEVA